MYIFRQIWKEICISVVRRGYRRITVGNCGIEFKLFRLDGIHHRRFERHAPGQAMGRKKLLIFLFEGRRTHVKSRFKSSAEMGNTFKTTFKNNFTDCFMVIT